MTDPIQYGDPIEVRDVSGEWNPAVARSEVIGTHEGRKKIHDFPVVYVALPGLADPVP